MEELQNNLEILSAIETLEYHNKIFLTENNALMCSSKRELIKRCQYLLTTIENKK